MKWAATLAMAVPFHYCAQFNAAPGRWKRLRRYAQNGKIKGQTKRGQSFCVNTLINCFDLIIRETLLH